jgi:ABC-type polar amino acid transport system ATPase subunit
MVVMRKLAGDSTTMIVVANDMGFARKAASRIVFLPDRGRIVETARHDKLSLATVSNGGKASLARLRGQQTAGRNRPNASIVRGT